MRQLENELPVLSSNDATDLSQQHFPSKHPGWLERDLRNVLLPHQFKKELQSLIETKLPNDLFNMLPFISLRSA